MNVPGGGEIRVAASSVTIDGFRFTCAADCLLVDQGSDDLVITNNDLSADTGSAITLASAWSGGAVTVAHNTLHSLTEPAVSVDSGAADLGAVTITRNAMIGPGVRNDLNPGVLDAHATGGVAHQVLTLRRTSATSM